MEVQYSPTLGYFIPDSIDCKWVAQRYKMGLELRLVNRTICDLMLAGF